MARKRSTVASIFTLTTVLALTGITPAHAEPSVIFQLTTYVDATEVGGDPVTPLRIIYRYDLSLAPGSGPYGSSTDGTFDSYAPLMAFIAEVGDECAAMSGSGTSVTVFNNAGSDRNEDSIDVRATGAALNGKEMFGLSVNFARTFLADVQGLMFSSTVLPDGPLFAEQADSQQTVVELIDVNNIRTRLEPGGAPYQFGVYDPVADISGLTDQINGSQVSQGLKKQLVAPLLDAAAFLGNALVQRNVVKARTALGDFIKLVGKNRSRLGSGLADSWTSAAHLIREELPACAF